MKEKRYFCDFWYAPSGTFKGLMTLIFLAMVVVSIIGGIINFEIITSKYGYELESYSADTYEYLDEIANNVISEGQGINLLAIPNDVVKYNVVREDNLVIFEYTLDNNKGMQFAFAANMKVELTESFEVISKHPNYSSEKEYVKDVKFAMLFVSWALGAIYMVLLAIIGLICCCIGARVSLAKKKKSLSNQQNGV